MATTNDPSKQALSQSDEDAPTPHPAKRRKSDVPTLLLVGSTAVASTLSRPMLPEPRTAHAFPTVVPMENPYTDQTYYVRACYPEYYDHVMGLLDTVDGVSVSGTEGIGKSIFMAYFFQRYSHEHPDATVVMVSYMGWKSVLHSVAVARGGIEIGRKRYHFHRVQEAEDVLAAFDERTLLLMDGIPDRIPHAGRWVAFPVPDEAWTKMLLKNPDTCMEVFLPVWTLTELRAAAIALNRTELLNEVGDDEVLDLGVDPAAIVERSNPAVMDYRVGLFGGVARWCFSQCHRNLHSPLQRLRGQVVAVTANVLATAVCVGTPPVQADELVHYVPVKYHGTTIQVASALLTHDLVKYVQCLPPNKQEELERLLSSVPTMRSVLDHAVKARVSGVLRSRGTITATKLGGDGADSLTMAVPPACNIYRITSRFGILPSDHSRDAFQEHIHTIERFAFQLPEDEGCTRRVVLFQVTSSLTCPVPARGYTKVLKVLGLWEAVEISPHTAAALVFVVPQWRQAVFHAQSITSTALLDDASAVADVISLDDASVDTLTRLLIRTVGDLRAFTPRERLSKATWKVVSNAQAKLELREAAVGSVTVDANEDDQVVQRIPQYVWGV